MVNVCMIGLGYWGKNLLRVFNSQTNVVAGVNKSSHTVDLQKKYPKIQFYNKYRDIIKDSVIDAVIIATPTHTHFEIAKYCLEQGKHVFLEKPMCSSLNEASQLMAIARKEKRVFFIGHIFLYHPCYKKLLKLIEQDEIDQIYVTWNKLGPFHDDLIFEIMPHDLSIAIDLFNETPYKSKIIMAEKIIQSIDQFLIRLQFSANKKYIVAVNRTHPFKSRTLRLTTTNGDIYYWCDDEIYFYDRDSKIYKSVFRNSAEPLDVECKAFLKHLDNKAEHYSDGEFSYEVIKALKDIRIPNVNS